MQFDNPLSPYKSLILHLPSLLVPWSTQLPTLAWRRIAMAFFFNVCWLLKYSLTISSWSEPRLPTSCLCCQAKCYIGLIHYGNKQVWLHSLTVCLSECLVEPQGIHLSMTRYIIWNRENVFYLLCPQVSDTSGSLRLGWKRSAYHVSSRTLTISQAAFFLHMMTPSDCHQSLVLWGSQPGFTSDHLHTLLHPVSSSLQRMLEAWNVWISIPLT